MKNLTKTLLAILIPAYLLIGSSPVNASNGGPVKSVKFHNGSFDSGLSKASTEGKLFFVEFYADWCTPCKWMDKTTFTNTEVVDLMNSHYVALKLDIETDDGSALKNKYAVKMLPTIMIFNAKGDMVEKVEKTLSPESMVSLLSFHDTHTSRIAVTYPYNTSPKKAANSNDAELNELYAKYLATERKKTNYKLQIANYTDYEEAFKKVNELSQTFMEPIIVINDYVDNMTLYKVMMGEFQSMEEAKGFSHILERDFGINSIIR